ncbi:periplasmic heavy metal sensor [Sulfitobacter sp. F26204]|uniref:periplasmic heavy metal sensor n=1 Tax=Sulfitobacter sp. F26204 TaxID=2996014 RepID=UPI00225DFAB1|nr:periplasmic heavy metal sensor [Sulfitobacter sp. F26204]MCX7560844.1 periplasmic heavy metal sensor [Sulfitobacter sp. F26204]
MSEIDSSKHARARGLKWAFGISLALNLVFIGVFAGAALRLAGHERGGHKMGQRMPSYGAPFVRALPRADQHRLNNLLKAHGGGLPSRAERRVLHQQLIDEMRASPFDADRVAGLFMAQNKAAQQVMGKAQDAWLEIVREMTVAERAAVADRLEERLMRRGHSGRKRH